MIILFYKITIRQAGGDINIKPNSNCALNNTYQTSGSLNRDVRIYRKQDRGLYHGTMSQYTWYHDTMTHGNMATMY